MDATNEVNNDFEIDFQTDDSDALAITSELSESVPHEGILRRLSEKSLKMYFYHLLI